MEIQELILRTNNLTQTQKFYDKIMGFQKTKEAETYISFEIGTSTLTFELSEEKYIPKYHFAFGIPTNKLDEAINWTLERTDLIDSGNSYITNFENWNAKAFYFYDNNHNIVEFICREQLNNPISETFSVNNILNINEVGLVSEEPIKTGTEIIEKIKTDFFSKDPKREDFAVVGNENGLFVISSPARNWYPTKNLAEKCNLKVKIKVLEKEYELEF